MDTPGAASTLADVSRAGGPRRRAATSSLRRLSRRVLIAGTVLALLAALGPHWAARAGVLLAVVAAVVACLAAWRELSDARHAHADEMLRASRTAGAALRDERQHNASVVATLTTRAVRATTEATQLRGTIAGLEVSVEHLQGTVVGLRREVEVLTRQRLADREQIQQRDEGLAVLRDTLRTREAELRGLLENEAHVRTLPRRVLTEPGTKIAPPSDTPRRSSADVEELGRDEEDDVSELVQVSVVLPNYEGERRFA